MSKLAIVEGEVVTKDGRGAAIEFFEEKFVLSDGVKTLEQARSVIRKGLITERLMKKVKNFKHVRTMQVVEFEESKEEAEQSEVDDLLLEATQKGCVPENLDRYTKPEDKVKVLKKAIKAFDDRVKKAAAAKKAEMVEEAVED